MKYYRKGVLLRRIHEFLMWGYMEFLVSEAILLRFSMKSDRIREDWRTCNPADSVIL